MLSGLMGTMAQGMAFGTGSAIAHRAVGAAASAMTGGGEGAPAQESPSQAPPQQQAGLCDFQQQSFFQCLQQNNGDAAACNELFSSLQRCQEQAKQFAS